MGSYERLAERHGKSRLYADTGGIEKEQNMRKLKKLEDLLSRWIEPQTRRDRPKGLSLLTVQSMQEIYYGLQNGKKTYFIVSDLVPYLIRCGITVEECGIGYVAYVEQRKERKR